MNECYTYFMICGDFDPREITRLLGLVPFRTREADGKRDCASWEFGLCDVYDVNVNEQIRKTIAPLLSKTEILNEIRERFRARFTVEVVPTATVDESTPILGPELDIIDFCHAVRADIDVDLYLRASDSEG